MCVLKRGTCPPPSLVTLDIWHPVEFSYRSQSFRGARFHRDATDGASSDMGPCPIVVAHAVLPLLPGPGPFPMGIPLAGHGARNPGTRRAAQGPWPQPWDPCARSCGGESLAIIARLGTTRPFSCGATAGRRVLSGAASCLSSLRRQSRVGDRQFIPPIPQVVAWAPMAARSASPPITGEYRLARRAFQTSGKTRGIREIHGSPPFGSRSSRLKSWSKKCCPSVKDCRDTNACFRLENGPP
jgi:hypothetical protein